MSRGMNRWCGIGNLGADPELRHVPDGGAVLNFRLACNEEWADKQGVKQARCEWVHCTLWGPRAEPLSTILSKGAPIYVEGQLRTSTYEKNGETRYRTEVRVSEVRTFGGRKASEQSDAPEREAPITSGNDDLIPF